MSSLDSYP